MPVNFDSNEWMVTIGLLLLWTVLIVLPKRLPNIITLMIYLFTCYMSVVADYIFAGDYPFNLYDTMDKPQFDLFNFMIYTFVYPLYGLIFIYFYEKWQPRKWRRIAYILAWVIISVVLEGISEAARVFTYHRWNLIYSSLAYIMIFAIEICFYNLCRYCLKAIK